jgi:hypothetical protein
MGDLKANDFNMGCSTLTQQELDSFIYMFYSQMSSFFTHGFS